jgi:hypothetical protein
MTEAVARAQPAAPSPPRLLAFIANATMVFPLVFLVLLYGEWFLGWLVLGHPPRPSIDDPKDIPVASSVHWVTLIALMGLLPIGLGAVCWNLWFVIAAKLGSARILGRMLAVVALFGGTITLIRLDPGRVVYWWFD